MDRSDCVTLGHGVPSLPPANDLAAVPPTIFPLGKRAVNIENTSISSTKTRAAGGGRTRGVA